MQITHSSIPESQIETATGGADNAPTPWPDSARLQHPAAPDAFLPTSPLQGPMFALTLEIDTAAGSLPVYACVHKDSVARPLVVVLHHRGGVDEHMKDVAHRLGREGFHVAVPDLFHRQPDIADPSERVRLLNDLEIVADVQTTLTAMQSYQPSSIAVIGFCSGGRSTYLCATHLELDAAVVFYGGNVMKAQGDALSPFERTRHIRCPVLGFFGKDDTNPSPQDVRAMSERMTELGIWHEFHSYNDTGHAFHNFLSPYYRDRAAKSSWTTMLHFLREKLR